MDWLQQTQQFMPHGMCLMWRPGLMALHIISDGLIAAAYFAIPIAIVVFVRGRTDLDAAHRALAVLFAAFITLCGLTHVASIIVLWHPFYVYEGWLKAATALVSVGTAAALLPVLVPQLLRISFADRAAEGNRRAPDDPRGAERGAKRTGPAGGSHGERPAGRQPAI